MILSNHPHGSVLAIVVFSVSMGHIANDAFEKFRYQFNSFAAERLKLLLETKHLYQKVSLLPEELLEVCRLHESKNRLWHQ